ncbi:MAG: hypothetical protein WC667_08770 [Sulfurimonas sp.]|jgi:hypothetical protein
MNRSLSDEQYKVAREAIMVHVRGVVPYALMVAVASGFYMIIQIFGKIGADGLSNFQIMLSIKAFLGAWLGLRGVNQKLFGINPFVFKSHLFPFSLVVVIILLSQLMHI